MSHSVIDNFPPKRLGPSNLQSLYPQISISNIEQKRLAAIANQIRSETQQIESLTSKQGDLKAELGSSVDKVNIYKP